MKKTNEQPLDGEVQTGGTNLPAIASHSNVAVGNFEFKAKKLVTRPVLKVEVDKPVAFKVQEPYVKTEDRVNEKTGEITRGPYVVNVINLLTGHEMIVVMNITLKGAWDSSYPNNSYVGKCFAIQKSDVGKRYKPVHVIEIDDPHAVNSGQ